MIYLLLGVGYLAIGTLVGVPTGRHVIKSHRTKNDADIWPLMAVATGIPTLCALIGGWLAQETVISPDVLTPTELYFVIVVAWLLGCIPGGIALIAAGDESGRYRWNRRQRSAFVLWTYVFFWPLALLAVPTAAAGAVIVAAGWAVHKFFTSSKRPIATLNDRLLGPRGRIERIEREAKEAEQERLYANNW